MLCVLIVCFVLSFVVGFFFGWWGLSTARRGRGRSGESGGRRRGRVLLRTRACSLTERGNVHKDKDIKHTITAHPATCVCANLDWVHVCIRWRRLWSAGRRWSFCNVTPAKLYSNKVWKPERSLDCDARTHAHTHIPVCHQQWCRSSDSLRFQDVFKLYFLLYFFSIKVDDGQTGSDL